MEAIDRERRERLILEALLERRVEAEEETRRIQSDLADLARRESELRTEITTLDAILGAMPEPTTEAEPPSLFAKPPASAPAAKTKRRRRRKGSRREQMIPTLRERFGEGAFTVEDVTGLIQEQEPGERRKAYYAAWSLCRDLEEDGLLVVVSATGSGRRSKKTYRFASAT